MKKIKDMHKYIIGAIIGIIIVGSISVYAVTAVIESSEVTYDNKESHGSFTDVQGSIDELYKRSGVMKTEWKDPILHGADPVFDDTKELIPVTIDDDGTVYYANLYTKWYEYETKRWANAVILTDDGKKKNYKTGDKILESDIESYFVWIPRYKYKIWDLGNYTTVQNLASLKDTASDAEAGAETALRRITGNARVIDIIFETKSVNPSTTQAVNSYYTHPAFTTLNVNGLWVGKFETGYKDAKTIADAQKDVIDSSKIIVKPNVYSWRYQTVGKMFKTALGYENGLGSHMMKNTEWGAVAYLSHSVYGIGREVNINNNSDYKTGYSAAANTDQSACHGTSGISDDVTQAWNTSTGYLASTTGNITGVYDMSGEAHEYMAAYMENYGVTSVLGVASGLSSSDFITYAKYFDKYSTDSNISSYHLAILGDATGEMGPFYNYFDKDKINRYHNNWYGDLSHLIDTTQPWFDRGGHHDDGMLAGQFSFGRLNGGVNIDATSRLVLAF